MPRQKESKKDRRKYVDSTISGNDLSVCIPGATDNTSPSRLQPLKKGKGNRLPPLNSRRLPELKHVPSDNRTYGGPAPLLPLARSDISSSKTDNDSITPSKNSKATDELNVVLPESIRTVSDDALKQERNNVLQNVCLHKKMDTEMKQVSSSTQQNEKNDKTTEKLARGNPTPKLLPEPSIVKSNSKLAKLFKQDSRLDYRKEKELLRQHRKQQAERMKVTRQPMKAIQPYDPLGKEVKRKSTDTENSQRSSSKEVKKVDLSVRRRCDDDDYWDWDKDIEEYMELEEKEKVERPSTSGQHPVQNGGHRLSPVPPLDSICSKRGVGFKSKKRIAEERLQTLARQEEERQKEQKEKDRIEMMLPQKVKKKLTKYGFK